MQIGFDSIDQQEMKRFYCQFLLLISCLLYSAGLMGQGSSLVSYEEPVWMNQAVKDTSYVDSLMKEGLRIQQAFPGTAMDFYKDGLALARELNSPQREGMALRLVGMVYANLGMYSQSIEVYTEELKLWGKLNSPGQTAWTYNNLGNSYSNTKAYELAIDCFQKASNYFKDAGKQIKATFPLVNLAALHRDRGEYQKALKLYKEILEVNENGEKVPQRDAAVYNNIGFTYETLEEYEMALKYYDLALKEKYEEGGFYSAINTLDNLTSVHLKLGNYDLAEMFKDSTRSMISRENGTEYLAPSLLNGALLLNETGNHKEAFKELKRYVEIKDSIDSGDQNAKVYNIMVVMNKVEEDVQLQLLQKDNELMNSSTQQKNLIILGLAILLLLLIGLIIARWRFTRQLRQANEHLQLKRDEISAQKDEIAEQKNNLLIQNEALAQAIQEKDGLIGFVAHDLKAPLNKTIGLLDLLDNSGGDQMQAGKVVGLLTKVNHNALELINDLLLISEAENKGEFANFEETKLNNLLETVAGEFSTMAERKEIRLSLKMEDELSIQTHPKSVSRILDNFISNAIKYSPKGSEVRVGLEKSAMGCRIFVCDEGPGISSSDQEKMFRKFQKLTARPTGGESSHGLGLAIAKSLADRIGVRIRCESVEGKGTTFFLTFEAA